MFTIHGKRQKKNTSEVGANPSTNRDKHSKRREIGDLLDTWNKYQTMEANTNHLKETISHATQDVYDNADNDSSDDVDEKIFSGNDYTLIDSPLIEIQDRLITLDTI